MAGTHTSASAIDWSLAKLINHPTVLEKARMEMDKVVGNNRLVEESNYRLPYIQAIIKETLRLHPPIPLISRKSMKECLVHWKGPQVLGKSNGIQAWEWFLQSNERDGPGVIDVKGQHFQLLPFGTGRKGWLGLSLAMQEVPTILAVMIQCFD